MVLVHAADARTRSSLRAVARRACPAADVAPVADAAEAARRLRGQLVESLLVDLGGDAPHAVVAADVAWEVAALATDFPHAPVVARLPLAPDGAWRLARCARLGVADVLVAGVDEPTAHAVVAEQCFSWRLGRSLGGAAGALRLTRPLQLAAWERIVARCGLPLSAAEVAASLGVARERLSRAFGGGGAPTLKQTIDVVRVAAAAALLESPALRAEDAARVLRVSSASHLSALTRRTVGVSALALAGVGAHGVVERFLAMRGRSE